MRYGTLHWAVALLVSLVAHIGLAAVVFDGEAVTIEQAGDSGGNVTVLGEAVATTLSAGTIAPAETGEADTLQPVTEASDRLSPIAIAEPVAQSAAQRAEAVDDPVTLAAVATPEVEQIEAIEDAAIAAPVPTPRPERPAAKAKQAKPSDTAKQAQPRETKRTTAERPKSQPARRKQSEPVRKRQPASSGAQGRSQQTAHLGTTANQSARQSRAGNAAVDNYPGRIARALRRARHYPREARRSGVTGEARIRFTVRSDGTATGIAIARSSGSGLLDAAAKETVRRAAPFPPIPRQAARNSWTFTVPLAFGQ